MQLKSPHENSRHFGTQAICVYRYLKCKTLRVTQAPMLTRLALVSSALSPKYCPDSNLRTSLGASD